MKNAREGEDDRITVKLDLSERFLQFAVDALKLFGQMNKSYAEIHISKQLTRSVTSCGANYEEACSAESKADFIHKLQIVLKELKESLYWFKLLDQAEYGEKAKVAYLLSECNELSKIIGKSIATSKNKAKQQE